MSLHSRYCSTRLQLKTLQVTISIVLSKHPYRVAKPETRAPKRVQLDPELVVTPSGLMISTLLKLDPKRKSRHSVMHPIQSYILDQ